MTLKREREREMRGVKIFEEMSTFSMEKKMAI